MPEISHFEKSFDPGHVGVANRFDQLSIFTLPITHFDFAPGLLNRMMEAI